MPRLKTDSLTVWGAVNDDGKVLVSSISAYRSVALRWASKYRNHHVERLCDVPRLHQVEEVETAPEPIMMKGNNGHSARVPYRKRVRG